MNDNTIKMFIGGEEVVSNKEFTINEEMLSASSTILNNCYPASWEESKDYVSNFYYPKDYSKYILGKGNFTYGTDQYYILTISGNNFIQFTTNVEKEFAGFTVYGNTTQETRSGKNLIHINSGTQTKNGVTITNNNDGTITVNGTCTAAVDIWFANGTNYLATNYAKSFANGDKLTLRKNIISGTSSGNWFIRVILYNTSTQQAYWNLLAKDMTYTATFNGETRGIELLANTGDTFNNLILFPQLEFGENATTPEQYGAMPSPEFPSDLVSVGYENIFDYNKITSVSNGSIVNDLITSNEMNGTSAYNVSIWNNLILKKGINYISADIRLVSGSTTFSKINDGISEENIINYPPLTNEFQRYIISKNYSADTTISRILVQFKNSTNAVVEIKNIMISKDNNSYIPYGKYGIAIKNKTNNMWENADYYTPIPTDNYNINNNGFTFTRGSLTGGKYISKRISVENGKTYTFHAISNDWNTNFYLIIYRGNVYGTAVASSLNGTIIYTSTANEDLFFTFIISSGQQNASASDIQITESAEIKPYQPYNNNYKVYELNDVLRGINNVKDKLYVENGILYLERNIGSRILNGSENWETIGNNRYYTAFPDKRGLTQPVPCLLMCNYFKATNNAGDVVNIGYMTEGYYTVANYNVFFNYNGVNTDLAGFKQWLSTHNLNVQYVLATPTIEELGAIELPYSYQGDNIIEIDTGIDNTNEIDYYWKNYDVLFAGIVKNSGDINLKPTNPKYCSLQILDYKTFLSESDTLDFVISDKTIAEAISMVVDAISGYGFILGTINISQADDIIGAYSTLNKTAYDVFQYLANISGSRWRARFVDSDTMAIDFYDPELLPRANDIDYTQQYWEDNKIVDLTFNYGTRDYRNKQIILSDEVYGGIDYTEVLLSNGYGTSYITQNNIANITSITVNGVEAEVITQSEKDLGVDADFYYTPGKNVVESTTSYTAGTQIIITYTPLVKGRQIVYNDEEVTRIATQTKTTGVISRYENRNDILSSDELENIAETYIKYKGKPEIILKLTTLNNDLFSIGEICYFNSPIADLAQDYMVKSKATNYTSVAGETNIFYTYELTSSFNSEKAINYFDNQRNKATGNIAEGESITRNIDINNSAMIIWENATITEISVSVDGDNALNSILNSPFIQ